MSAPAQPEYTPEQYLALERRAETKSEYVNGRVYAMTGASANHNRITGNVYTGLRARLRGRPCEAFMNDMRVKVTPTGLYTYPDVVVVCGPPEWEDADGFWENTESFEEDHRDVGGDEGLAKLSKPGEKAQLRLRRSLEMVFKNGHVVRFEVSCLRRSHLTIQSDEYP